MAFNYTHQVYHKQKHQKRHPKSFLPHFLFFLFLGFLAKLQKKMEEKSEGKMQSSIVKFNVGGSVFMTTIETISPSLFLSKLVQNEKENKFRVEKVGECLFIDRSPKLFEAVLSFLRTKTFKARNRFFLFNH